MDWRAPLVGSHGRVAIRPSRRTLVSALRNGPHFVMLRFLSRTGLALFLDHSAGEW